MAGLAWGFPGGDLGLGVNDRDDGKRNVVSVGPDRGQAGHSSDWFRSDYKH